VVQPTIQTIALNADEGLAPGSTLSIQLTATPRAADPHVVLSDRVRVNLREQRPGVYTGNYVVRRSDRIDPTQHMTARVTFGNRVYTNTFSYPPSFQALAMGAPSQAVAVGAPVIDRLVVRPMGRVEPGRELRFRLQGAPGGDAWLDIPGVISGVDLRETSPGVYEGSYTVRRRDDLDAFDRVVATLQSGNQRATARLDLRGGDDRDFTPPGLMRDRPQVYHR